MEDTNKGSQGGVIDAPPPAIEPEDTSIQVYGPTMEMARFVNNYAQVVAFCESKLIENIDYGKIPGTNKKSMWLPAAEKLNRWFSLRPEISGKLDTLVIGEKTILSYTSMTLLRDRDGVVRGFATANCNTAEEKYADRDKWLTESKLPAGIDKSKLESKTMNARDGGKFTLYQVKNISSPISLLNTIIAMADKRSFVRAVRMATATSSIFEDADDIDDGKTKGGNGKPQQQTGQQSTQQKKPDAPPPQLTPEQTEALDKRATFYKEWFEKSGEDRAKEVLRMVHEVYRGQKDSEYDPVTWPTDKQMLWLLDLAAKMKIIPADPTVAK